MGIEGLLPLLKPVTHKTHISTFDGKTAAVDASAWLYKGIYSCSWELGNGLPTHGYLNYPLKMIRMLQKNNVKPILVFDGTAMPLKEQTIKKRKDDKKKSRELAQKYLSEGKKEQAASMFARCMTVQTEMLSTLMDVLYHMNVDYVVAPYEADAEIAFLCREKLADFAISEDSDILVYGCTNLVLKLDIEGTCENVLLNDTLFNQAYMETVKNEYAKDLASLPRERFMELCIMSGCDYLDNIPGIGIKKALKLMKFYTLEETLGKIKYKKQFIGKVPEDYKDRVDTIKLQFLNGRIIDPRTNVMTELAPLPATVTPAQSEQIGKMFDPAVVERYTKGLYSVRKNISRDRITAEEVARILKEMALANRQKYYVENKSSVNAYVAENKVVIKDAVAKSAATQEQKVPAAEESKEERDKKPQEPSPMVKEEIDQLLRLALEGESAARSEPKRNGRKEQGTPTKPNPFAKCVVEKGQQPQQSQQQKSAEKAGDKRRVYSLYAGESITKFFTTSEVKKPKLEDSDGKDQIANKVVTL